MATDDILHPRAGGCHGKNDWAGPFDFSTPWKKVFHGVEKIGYGFPWCGKNTPGFSTVWKKVFHSVEKTVRVFHAVENRAEMQANMSMSKETRTADGEAPVFRPCAVVHWLPKPSETFVLDEIRAVRAGAPGLEVATLYGGWRGELSPELSAEGLTVHRLGCRAVGRVIGAAAYWLRAEGPAARRLWREVPWRRWCDWEMAGENLWGYLCGFALARLARERGYTHLHAWWANGPATAAWVASRLTGIPFSFTGWAGDLFPPDGALAEKIRDAVFVRSTCAAFVPHLQAHAGNAPGKVRLLRNGQDASRFDAVRPAFAAPLRLLVLGRLVAKKGMDDALRAVAILKDGGLEVRLTVGGGGPEARRLRRLARRLGVAEIVEFAGFVPRHRTRELFRACDVFLMPSRPDAQGDRDGIPNVVMEALLHGIPVVATAVGGIPELIRDGETGRLTAPGDPGALAEAVRDLARDPEGARALAERGRERVRRDHDLATSARTLGEWLRGD